MKKIFLLVTKPWYFLTEIPPLTFFVISIINNKNVDTIYRLYPLIVALGLIMVFIFLYFLRAVTISLEEIRTHGLFAERDSVVLKKGRTLVLSKLDDARIKLEVYGKSNDEQVYSWLSADDGTEINLFRTKALGGNRQIISILKYFGIPSEDAKAVLSTEGFEKEYKDFILTSETTESAIAARLLFKTTL